MSTADEVAEQLGGPWTRHGHAIPGVTVAGSGRPTAVARCGGPAMCRQCGEDAEHARAAKGGAEVLAAADEVAERPSAETLGGAMRLLVEHMAFRTGSLWGCTCGWAVPDDSFRVQHAAHVVQQLAVAGLLAAMPDDRPADAPAPRPARRVGSFAAPGGPRRLADEEG